MSEAKNKMSLTERIRTRIGDSALYGGKNICDSPQNRLATNNKKSSRRTQIGNRTIWGTLTPENVNVIAGIIKNARAIVKMYRLACGTICAQIATANSTRTMQRLKTANTFGGTLNVPTRQASLNSTLWGTLTPKDVNVMASLLKKVQRAAENTARIINTTEFMNITINGGYNA